MWNIPTFPADVSIKIEQNLQPWSSDTFATQFGIY